MSWTVLVYRVPSEPASRRVSVWRQLKRMGALYLQQCVCMLPARDDLVAELDRCVAVIRDLGGEFTLFDIPQLRPGDDERIVGLFRDLRNKEYDEIIEECETKFVKEIEFERFRENYTYAETEEIRQDLDKIRRWHQRVVDRDWFGADRRLLTEEWIARCERLLEEFEQDVYQRQSHDVSPDAEAALSSVGVKLDGRRSESEIEA